MIINEMPGSRAMVWHPDMPMEYRNQIVTGDCRALSEWIPSESVDFALLDPPFFLPAQHYATRKRWARSVADLSLIESFFDWLFVECRRILRPSGILIVCCDGQSYPIMYIKLYRLFDRLVDVIWDKTQIGLGYGIRYQHELILLGMPSGGKYPNWMSSIVHCIPVPSQDRIHPAEKPVRLWVDFLTTLATEEQIAVDLMCGSASALVAAKICGLNYIGFELDPDYADLARRRVANIQPPLFVSEPRQLELETISG